MTVVKAALIALRTADGLVECGEGVEVGREYLVDVDTRRTVQLFNFEHGCRHTKEIINAVDGAWLPMELLRLQVN